MTRWLALVCACIALISAASSAHEIGTTRVTITIADDRYDIEILTDAGALAEKLASTSEVLTRRVQLRFDGQPVTPNVTHTVRPSRDTSPPVAVIHLTGDMPAGTKTLTWRYGWTFATYSLTVTSNGNRPATLWIEGGAESPSIPLVAVPAASSTEIAWAYVILGFTHIVPHGLDHMLFVLGIFLLTRKASAILWQVSAFTLAHSVTLGLGVFGVITISPRIVEPLIALSIAYVAVENILLPDLTKRRLALVFAFGLLHGLGFAGALGETGLPRSSFAAALIGFNAGVELGQLAVIAMAMLAIGWYGRRDWYRPRIVVPISAAIACIALYWMFERIVS